MQNKFLYSSMIMAICLLILICTMYPSMYILGVEGGAVDIKPEIGHTGAP
jgi:hypothetical protein